MKKSRGRTALADDVKRTNYFNVRYTDEEYKQIIAACTALGISRTEYVRRKSLDINNAIVVNANALTALLDTVGEELGRSGNNINQLAKHANTLNLKGQLDEVTINRFNILFEDYIKTKRETETAIRKIIREIKR